MAIKFHVYLKIHQLNLRSTGRCALDFNSGGLGHVRSIYSDLDMSGKRVKPAEFKLINNDTIDSSADFPVKNAS